MDGGRDAGLLDGCTGKPVYPLRKRTLVALQGKRGMCGMVVRTEDEQLKKKILDALQHLTETQQKEVFEFIRNLKSK